MKNNGMIQVGNRETNYGNWVPAAMMKTCGIAEVHYIGNVEKEEFIPGFVTAPWMIKGVGLIYGKK